MKNASLPAEPWALRQGGCSATPGSAAAMHLRGPGPEEGMHMPDMHEQGASQTQHTRWVARQPSAGIGGLLRGALAPLGGHPRHLAAEHAIVHSKTQVASGIYVLRGW
jgi:hypothetical protein